MIVELSEHKEVYKVRFHRTNNLQINRGCFDTYCLIYLLEDIKGKIEDRPRVAMGVAYQSPKDKYNKMVGRKIALSRALDQILPNDDPANKKFRKVFWDTFRKEFGKWR